MSKEIECIAGTDYDGDMKVAYLKGILTPNGEFLCGEISLWIVDDNDNLAPLKGRVSDSLVFAEVSR